MPRLCIIVSAVEECPFQQSVQLIPGFLIDSFSGKGKDADSGTYYCVAKNKYGEVWSREASLKIAMLRDDFRIRPRPIQVVWKSET